MRPKSFNISLQRSVQGMISDHARICHYTPLSPEEVQMVRTAEMPLTGQYIDMQSDLPLSAPNEVHFASF